MVRFVRFFIRVYQCTLSPLLRLLCGPDSGCRFTPSCWSYFLEAVEVHGVFYGSWLGFKRLARCQPWGGSGYDPVPPRRTGRSEAASLTRLECCQPPDYAGFAPANPSDGALTDLGRV